MKSDELQYEVDQWAAAPIWKLVVVGVGMVVMVPVVLVWRWFKDSF